MAWLEETAKRSRDAGETGEEREPDLVVTEERLGPEEWLFRATRGGICGTKECIDPEYLELKRTGMDNDLWHLVATVKEGLMLAQQALEDLEKHCKLHGNVHEDMHTVDQWDGVEYPCAEILEQGKDVSESLNAAFGIVDERLEQEAREAVEFFAERGWIEDSTADQLRQSFAKVRPPGASGREGRPPSDKAENAALGVVEQQVA